MESFTLEYDNIGSIRFERSRRARNMSISIRPFKGIRVAVPYGMTFKQAEELTLKKSTWIANHLKQMRIKEKRLNNQPPDIPINEAKSFLGKQVEELANKHGFKFGSVFVKNMTSRWGSCSVKNNINLNRKILHLPAKLREYVILHELVHTVHKNHSVLFWTTLSDACGVDDAKDFNRKLKRFGEGGI